MQSKTLLSLLAATGAFLQAEMASAQALPPSVRTPQADKTLGTQVSGNGNNFNITGGLNRGQTLFHSFKDFSIPTGGAANFKNPAGTRDIISRVTGNLFSDLNGTLNSNGANFLLINPNGVVFGPNARLNVGKAFAASTANGVELFDGQGRQFTFGTKPGGDAPLLKINPNVFLNISRLNMGASVPKNPGIVNYGKLQTNNDSQYIGLIGGNVTLDGKYGGGKIVAPGGRVDLGGLNSAGTVSTDAQGLVFGGNGLVRGDVLLTNDALVTARANGTLGTVNPLFSNLAVAGSNININANNLNILNSGAKSNTGFAAIDNGLEENSGIKTQPAGNINVNATGLVNLDNANIKNTLRPGAEGKIGDVKINANSLSLINKSIISSTTLGKGNAGDININANSLSLINSSSISTNNKLGNGDAGDININANSLSLINDSDISTSNLFGKGDAGNINIKTTGDISIVGTTPQSTEVTTLKSNDSSISSDTNGQGNTGKITIDTRGKLLLLNNGNIASRIGPTGVGKGNDIKILAQAIELTNGSTIITNNVGKLDVKDNENKKIARALGITDADLNKFGFTKNVGAIGDAGNIDIKTTGDIRISSANRQLDLNRKMTAKSTLSDPLSSSISSSTNGQGNAGGITIDTQNLGKLSVSGGADISSAIGPQAVGKGNGIKISAQAVDLIDGGTITTSNIGAKGDAGNIRIDTIGDISLLSSLPRLTNMNLFSSISTATLIGQGNAGKITLDTHDRGKLSLSNGASISSGIGSKAVGNGGGIAISAREIDLQNQSSISTSNGGGKGDAGSIDLKTTGDINIFGSIPGSTGLMTQNSNLSFISSTTSGQGKAGKITIDTQDRGKLLLDRGDIFSTISKKAVGNGGDIKISAREIDLRNRSIISSSNFGGKGDAGNIDLKTIGNVSLFDSNIASSTTGQGKAGNITIDTQDRGKLSLDRAEISSTIEGQKAVGNGGKIAISAREIDLRNGSVINSDNVGGKGDAGNIEIKTIGDISISGSTPESTAPITPTSDRSRISSFTLGQGNAGKITIDTQNRGKLSLSNRSFISNEISKQAVGNSPEISISARELDLRNQSFINSTNFGGIGDVGNIKIDTIGAVEITNSSISSTNLGQGKTGDISLASDRITLNSGILQAESVGGTGGNIQLTTRDRLLLRNLSDILTRSGSNEKNGNGGNITINSPLIIALPGTSDIAADAVGGNGGRVDIISKGLFGIQFRPRLSNLTNDITSSSTFGQSGTVNISTPGTDPGKDSTVLPTVPTDASNQIAQTCGASRENKFVVAGRGGIPSNANDPLTSDVVWQDARGTNSQPTASSATTDPTKLAPPATGLVFDGKGKATLIAAGTQGQPTGTSVVCPSVVRK